MAKSFIGTLEEGQVYISTLPEDSRVEIKVKNEKDLRSYAQLKYYFGVVIDILCDFHGETPVSMHMLIKKTMSIETTTDLDTGEFAYLMNLIRDLWLNHFDVYIPKPNEVEDLRSLEKYLF